MLIVHKMLDALNFNVVNRWIYDCFVKLQTASCTFHNYSVDLPVQIANNQQT